MKKSFYIALICIFGLFILTGCGKEDEIRDLDSPITNEEISGETGEQPVNNEDTTDVSAGDIESGNIETSNEGGNAVNTNANLADSPFIGSWQALTLTTYDKNWYLYLTLEDNGNAKFWLSDPELAHYTVEGLYEGKWSFKDDMYHFDMALNQTYDSVVGLHDTVICDVCMISNSSDNSSFVFNLSSGDTFLDGLVNDGEEFDRYYGDMETLPTYTEVTYVTDMEVENYLRSMGINGLLYNDFTDINKANIGIVNVIHQFEDDSVDYDYAYELVEKQDGEIYTDCSFGSRAALDEFFRKNLGVFLDSAVIDKDASYLKEIDTWYLQHGDTNYLTFDIAGIEKTKYEITVNLTNVLTYEPRDIRVVLNKNTLGSLRIKSIEQLGSSAAASLSSEYVIPYSDSVYLNEHDLENLSEWELKIARNEIYARHGRKFKSEELQNYFDSCNWYFGCIDPEDFDDSFLSQLEKDNISLIEKYEKKH